MFRRLPLRREKLTIVRGKGAGRAVFRSLYGRGQFGTNQVFGDAREEVSLRAKVGLVSLSCLINSLASALHARFLSASEAGFAALGALVRPRSFTLIMSAPW
jgi:hypothetical protein